LRAATTLKTPDAIHAATAAAASSVLFVTNDADFRGNVSMLLVILADLLTP
jgi:predicted nucleic acid-binding protein